MTLGLRHLVTANHPARRAFFEGWQWKLRTAGWAIWGPSRLLWSQGGLRGERCLQGSETISLGPARAGPRPLVSQVSVGKVYTKNGLIGLFSTWLLILEVGELLETGDNGNGLCVWLRHQPAHRTKMQGSLLAFNLTIIMCTHVIWCDLLTIVNCNLTGIAHGLSLLLINNIMVCLQWKE